MVLSLPQELKDLLDCGSLTAVIAEIGGRFDCSFDQFFDGTTHISFNQIFPSRASTFRPPSL
jgi:hypothetical protein